MCSHLSGQTIEWNNLGGGTFETGSNWVGGTTPGPSNDAGFGLGSAGYTIDFLGNVTNDRIFIGTDKVTFDLSSSTYTLNGASGSTQIATGFGDSADLTIANGTFVTTKVRVGSAASSIGTVTLNNGATWNNANDSFLIGDQGVGSLQVTTGTTFQQSNASVFLGATTSGVGSLRVEGFEAVASMSTLLVGQQGRGSLTVADGGVVESPNSASLLIGNDSGSLGSVAITGTSSRLTFGQVNVGSQGQGFLDIFDGSLLETSATSIGKLVEGVGFVNVNGTDSRWENSAQLLIGELGIGSLLVKNNGTVSNTSSRLGQEPSSTGIVTVTGSGSNWNNSEHIDLGLGGNGTLRVQNGGAVTNTFTHMGVLLGSNGSATVSGAGSTWTNSDRLIVGISGQASLIVKDAGVVTNTFSTIGAQGESISSATVRGAGSTWINSGRIWIGELGHGTLLVEAGGSVSNTIGSIGFGLGSIGNTTIRGPGSIWTNSGSLFVGDNGSGALRVEAGGTALSTAGYIGSNPDSTGTAVVTGIGSQWDNSGALNVGNSGFGNLIVQNGGTVSNTSASIGAQFGAVGNAIVDGADSTWNSTAQLTVGNSGTGSLTIQNGGAVSSGGSINDAFTWNAIGNNSGSSGTVNINGSGSNWTINGPLEVGDRGTGTLNLRDGGTVAAAGPVLVNPFLTGSKIVLDNSTLTSEAVFAGVDDLQGVGTIDTQGWSFDEDYVIDDPSDFQPQFSLNSQPGQDIAVNLDLSAGIGRLGAGYGGTGSLRISNGQAVGSSRGFIGYRTGSEGTVTVEGTGSSWTTSDSIGIGLRGQAALLIQNGGTVVNNALGVNSVGATIGSALDSAGTVVVDGPSSTWTVGGDLLVGSAGTGTLEIQNGGEVIALDTMHVDRLAQKTGQVNFSNGTLTAETVIAASDSLRGTGTIDAQGWVFATDAIIAQPSDLQRQFVLNALPAQNVTVNLDLTSGNGDLGAGIGGSGSLMIQNGMNVTSKRGLVGYYSESIATATVDGIGSTWITNGGFSIGNFNENGFAVLGIQNGGAVVTHETADIGLIGNGATIVAGNGSNWIIDGSLRVGTLGFGKLTIKDAGSVTVGNNAEFDRFNGGEAVLEFIVGQDGAGLLDVTGTVSIGQNTILSATFESGMVPSPGAQYTIVAAAGGINGTFANEPLQVLSSEWLLNWDVQYNANDITLELLSAILAADFDASETVDGADLLVWKTNYGTSTGATHMQGDANGDGDVDGHDFLTWQRSFGNSNAPLASATAVPEPSTTALFLAGMSVLISGRQIGWRRRSRVSK